MFDKIKRVESSDENVSKFVFTTEGEKGKGAVAEAVLYKYPTFKERTVICCSTQSGCPIGCRFCGTGDFFIRNLSSEEIVYQVDKCFEHALEVEGTPATEIEKCQIMFMSMGEPMLNWKELKKALFILNEKYPEAALLISTSAPAVYEHFQDMIKVSGEIDKIGLQFSIHEATDKDRDHLIPFKAKMNLRTISDWGYLWYKYTGRRPYFNYCVHDENNGLFHVEELTKHFPPTHWECTLSVICESDEGVAAANRRQRELVTHFMDKMLEAGHSVRMFDPAGQDDIGGGCGQLWYVQDFAKNNPNLIIKTAGTGLEKVHTPMEKTNED
jgi:23S rRNA (adenine2503-C2)-methyltransferase